MAARPPPRACSELLWSVKHCTGPLRSAVDPYELELEGFPEGIQWHPDDLQCNHEVCVLGLLKYASVEFSPETLRSDIPRRVWYKILYQHIILHEVWGLNNTASQPNEAAKSLSELEELFSPADREEICPHLMRHIELLESVAAGTVQQSEGDDYLSDVDWLSQILVPLWHT